MPFDGTINETETQEPSLDGLIAWLETQPPEKEYCWSDGDQCAIAQYAKSIGKRFNDIAKAIPIPAPEGWLSDVPYDFDLLALRGEHTFGSLLNRARVLRENAKTGV